jgi:nicotinate-nucleotide adenylyltransferase
VKYIADNFLYAEQQVKNILSEERFKHTLRVADYAIKLCKAQNYFMVKETYAAALYHDICKEMSDDIILNLVGKNYDKTKFPTTHTLHGLAAAQYIQKNFNITNENVINAVANHVIPSNKSTILDAIIYCADKLEPERTTEDVPNRIIYEKIIKQDLMYVFNKLVNETKKKFEKC